MNAGTRATHLVGVDVGTRSVRAGLFDASGEQLAKAVEPIRLRREGDRIFEQDSEDIWRALCRAVQSVVAAAVEPATVTGIGFAATCSLVVRDRLGDPLALSETDGTWDTILWMDHRAQEEAALLSRLEGGRRADVLSPEMQGPKALWLKRRRPELWERTGHLFDLVDFLTWKASGALARSHCSLACKWPYRSGASTGWRRELLAAAGLDDLLERGALPETGVAPGSDLGALTPDAASALGLTEACRVSAGLIDGHAGALGALGPHLAAGRSRRLALIAGTSNALMTLCRDEPRADGLWGPYGDAVLESWWLVEGGQSAAGELLDHIIRSHAAGDEPTPALRGRIEDRVAEGLRQDGPGFARDLLVLPDFHGLRTPPSPAGAKGAIVGLTLDESFDGLCRRYWRTAVGLAAGLRGILETMEGEVGEIEALDLVGGHAESPVLSQLYADMMGKPVQRCSWPDRTLLGAAMIGAVAAGVYPDLNAAAREMAAPPGELVDPAPGDPYRGDRNALSALAAQLRSSC